MSLRSSTPSPRVPDPVAQAINLGQLALLLGNGIDRVLSDAGFDWTTLLRRLAGKLKRDDSEFEAFLKEGRLQLAADYLSAHHGAYVGALRNLLREVRWSATPPRLLLMKLIASLKPRCILTTNYSPAIEQGLRDVGYDTFSIRIDSDLVALRSQPNPPFVYVHGTTDNPVLTYSDYFAHRATNPQLWAYVQTLLQSNLMVGLGIQLEEAEFDLYESLYRARAETKGSNASHVLLVRGRSVSAAARTAALEQRFGLSVVPFDKDGDYLEFYIEVLSWLLIASRLPFVGDSFAKQSPSGVFCGLLKRNVVVYPAHQIDGSSGVVVGKAGTPQPPTVPNSTVYTDAILEVIGGGATVAAVAFARLDSAGRQAAIFAKGPRREVLERLGEGLFIGFDGVESNSNDAPTVVINAPNDRDGDERLILDVRETAAYTGHKAHIACEPLAREQMRRLVPSSKIVFFDRWGCAWLPAMSDALERAKDIPVVLDPGWTGGTVGKRSISPESDFGSVVTHLITSLPPLTKYLQFASGTDSVDAVVAMSCEPERTLTQLREKVFPRLKFLSLTLGALPVHCAHIDESGVFTTFKIPSLPALSPMRPMNPLGCGDVWRGAFCRALVENPVDYKFAACVGTLSAYWHLVGGVDSSTWTSLGLRGIPESLATWANVSAVANHTAHQAAEWRAAVERDAGVDVRNVSSRCSTNASMAAMTT